MRYRAVFNHETSWNASVSTEQSSVWKSWSLSALIFPNRDLLTEGRALRTPAKNVSLHFPDEHWPESARQFDQLLFPAKEPLIRSRVHASFHDISRPPETSASSVDRMALPRVADFVTLLYWFWLCDALRIAALRLFNSQIVQLCFQVATVGKKTCLKVFCYLGWCRKRQLILPARFVKGARKAKIKRRQVMMTRAPKWAYTRGLVTIACPSHSWAPCPKVCFPRHIGLNNMFRGGAGRRCKSHCSPQGQQR